MTGRAMLFKVIALVAFIVVINVKDADSRCPVNACQQGPAYCQRAEYETKNESTAVSTTTFNYKETVYYERCHWLTWARCQRIEKKKIYTTKYRLLYRSVVKLKCIPGTCTDGYWGIGRSCKPSCWPHGCENGECTSPRKCTCRSGWGGKSCNQPICPPPCDGGRKCVAPGDCRFVCSQYCRNGGSCTGPNTCTCASGWNGTSCDKPVCAPPCDNGTLCVKPNVCECPKGWTGSQCKTAICKPSCRNGGICTKPGVCSCPEGWEGYRCTIRSCSKSCKNGGHCIATCEHIIDYFSIINLSNGSPYLIPYYQYYSVRYYERQGLRECVSGFCTSYVYGFARHEKCILPRECKCPSKWTGPTCETAVCSPSCGNGGHCTSPGVCTCPNEWTGSRCETAVCSPPCQNGGNCTSPGVCHCTCEWTGDYCTNPVCSPPCQNGGTCTAPGECTCESGWTGDICTKSVEASPAPNRICYNVSGLERERRASIPRTDIGHDQALIKDTYAKYIRDSRSTNQTLCSALSDRYLLVVLDSSGSIGEETFNHVKEAVANISYHFCDYIKVALVTFDDEINLEFCFNETQERNETYNRIINATYRGGLTYSTDTLQCVCNHVLSQPCGIPHDIKPPSKIDIVFFTDDRPNGRRFDPLSGSQRCSDPPLSDIIQVYLHGIGNFNTKGLGYSYIEEFYNVTESHILQNDNLENLFHSIETKLQEVDSDGKKKYSCVGHTPQLFC